ncbi:hypothetical protein NFI96_023757 [Prochilodus magdalenae]|nr:hypothetical protein NFI96_023757 [Prochilodus magdalenae]
MGRKWLFGGRVATNTRIRPFPGVEINRHMLERSSGWRLISRRRIGTTEEDHSEGSWGCVPSLCSPALFLEITFPVSYRLPCRLPLIQHLIQGLGKVPHHHPVELRGNPSVKVAPSRLSVWCKKDSFKKNKYDSTWLKTESSFRTGRYYWEVEVGQKLEWEIGICSSEAGKDVKDTVLCYSSGLGYHVQQGGHGNKRKVHVSSRPRRVGVYLDCERKQVSFYDAESMTLMDTGTYVMTTCAHSLCLGPGQYLRGKNSDPLTVCWY